jgi:medium-chain acyl-[acyl-carrier-protein] hydrolase
VIASAGGTSWILRPRPRPAAQVRLFCFPYAGVGASAYRAWQAALPPEIEACGVQPPGRENRFREPLVPAISGLAAAAADGLQPHLDKPFAFFGHSLGALVSFEVARLLRRRGVRSPLHLFVSACRAPQLPDPHPPLHGLPAVDFVREVRDRYDAIPAAVADNEEMLQLVMPVVRADFEAFETYLYSADTPLDCPISCFGGTQDRFANPEELKGWQRQTNREFRLRLHPGGHFFLQSAESEVLEELAAELAVSAGAHGSGRNQETSKT